MVESFKPIIAKDIAPIESGGTIINGEPFSFMDHNRIDEMREISENFNTCACHMEQGVMVCWCPEGKLPEPNLSSVESETISLGRVVKNPMTAITLMEEAALHSLSRLERAKVPAEDVNKHLDTMVNHITDVSSRLNSTGLMNKARHDALQFIKRAELPVAAIASATIFAATRS